MLNLNWETRVKHWERLKRKKKKKSTKLVFSSCVARRAGIEQKPCSPKLGLATWRPSSASPAVHLGKIMSVVEGVCSRGLSSLSMTSLSPSVSPQPPPPPSAATTPSLAEMICRNKFLEGRMNSFITFLQSHPLNRSHDKPHLHFSLSLAHPPSQPTTAPTHSFYLTRWVIAQPSKCCHKLNCFL